MPRAKEFDPDTVLEKAMDLFWTKGYEATSIKMLVGHMGINRFSLYSTFGDKHQLFLSATERYHQKIADAEIAILENSDDGIASIRRYFVALVERYTGESGSKGCFMTNTTTELAPHDAAAKERTGAFLLQMQAAFYHALLRAQTAGELREARLNDYARFLTSTAQGIAVLAKIGPSREILDSIVDVAMRSIR
jgi:TetR/AcrR family transcriptional repressor of nem operon